MLVKFAVCHFHAPPLFRPPAVPLLRVLTLLPQVLLLLPLLFAASWMLPFEPMPSLEPLETAKPLEALPSQGIAPWGYTGGGAGAPWPAGGGPSHGPARDVVAGDARRIAEEERLGWSGAP